MMKAAHREDAWKVDARSAPIARGMPGRALRTTQNALLNRLPLRSRQALLERCERVELSARMHLQDRGLPIRYAYFIESGAASVSTRAGDCLPVEIHTLGKKDFVGIPLVLGMRIAPHCCTVQVPGTALRIGADALLHLVKIDREVEKLLLRYIQATLVQSAQLVACNSRHNLTQKVARWLLIAQDRMETAELAITHRCLAQALGVRRASITETFGEMEAAGLIRRHRKHIAIADEHRMAAVSCNCYRVIQLAHETSLSGVGVCSLNERVLA